ncbi:hypothetical protein [Chryseobacterium populi]|uniref:Uncharacterized protein n=1 Tax=Chryseobacterium populi TaxID=1144316 RepID=J2SSM1_9FLAO|nr:hypothetical protein [Chryseobacterium populi]EJL68547.1 hypothetical protein PMI13_03569 [Chryseobacterium populi]
MKKISLNNIILFRQKLDKNRKAFLSSLRRKDEIKSEGGGNYWVRSLSALSNGFKLKDNQPLKEKISEILELFTPALTKQIKEMYQRNLDILHNYEDFDFSEWLPENSKILSKTNKKSIIYINTIPVQITPSQIYSFEKNGNIYVGAIWFVAKLKGYKIEELGMFAEALYIYLSNNFDQEFELSAENCLIVDVLGKKEVNYQMLIDEEIPSIFNTTLELIKNTH